jgi:hypothetical protein
MVGACSATLAVALAVFAGVGSLTLTPIAEHLAALDRADEKINLTMAPLLTLYAQHKADEDRFVGFQIAIDGKLGKDVFEMSRNGLVARIDTLVSTDDKARDEVLAQVHRLEDTIVTRQENVVHWNATDALALRVNELAGRQCK